ncbi:hypothetical protein M885DRAFT_611746 [Pelagophyceae sp. CCMP2097]|nr:hypothetical protein M885DRAFT_611746 [Pelagophyceae sp. CCMP2097]
MCRAGVGAAAAQSPGAPKMASRASSEPLRASASFSGRAPPSELYARVVDLEQRECQKDRQIQTLVRRLATADVGAVQRGRKSFEGVGVVSPKRPRSRSLRSPNATANATKPAPDASYGRSEMKRRASDLFGDLFGRPTATIRNAQRHFLPLRMTYTSKLSAAILGSSRPVAKSNQAWANVSSGGESDAEEAGARRRETIAGAQPTEAAPSEDGLSMDDVIPRRRRRTDSPRRRECCAPAAGDGCFSFWDFLSCEDQGCCACCDEGACCADGGRRRNEQGHEAPDLAAWAQS